ncbi:MAG: glycosyltransferase family 2 protein [Ignavibacteriales bacterium]|nr:glycosyltransferase family 2 protein [Ignavibacteriales bacterium]
MGFITKTIAILIPAFNAEWSLAELVRRVRTAIGEVQIVVVDDGSTDQTHEGAASVGAVVLRHEKNRGKGAALQTGFDYFNKQTGIEFIITMDADLQHQPEEVPKFLLVQQKTNADIVIGWREKIGTRMPIHRKISNTITSALVGLRTGVKIKDSQCGFRLMRRSVIDCIKLETTGYEAETEFLIKAARRGFKLEFVPVQTIYGVEKSYMTHWTTTVNFIKVILRNYE